MRRMLTRFNFSCNLIECRPQFLTGYIVNIGTQCKKPTAQTAHLGFSDTRVNTEKPKGLFFANAQTETENKSNR